MYSASFFFLRESAHLHYAKYDPIRMVCHAESHEVADHLTDVLIARCYTLKEKIHQ